MEHMWDPFWWDMAGRDIIDQRHIFDRFSGEEQKGKLRAVLREFPRKGGRILDKAARGGFVDAVVALLDLGVVPIGNGGVYRDEDDDAGEPGEGEAGIERESDDGEEDKEENEEFAPLHSAAFEGHLECVKILVENGNLDVDAKDDLGTTPLLNAARQGHISIVQWLLEQGADATFKSKSKVSIQQAAAMSGNPEVLRLVLDDQKSVDAGMKLGDDIMGFATHSGKIEMVEFVLGRAGFPKDDDDDVEGKKWKGERLTEEQRAAIEGNLWRSIESASLDSVQLLLSYLTQHNEDGSFQYYPIKDNAHRIATFNATEDAMSKDNPEVFELVWESFLSPPASILDAQPEARALQQEWLHRRLISAAGPGALKVATLIIEKYKANPNHISIKYHTTPLFIAAAQGHVELLRYLLENHDPDIHVGNGKYSNGPTALHNAILNRQDDVVQLLLKYGGPVESLDKPIQPIIEKSNLFVAAFKSYRAPVKIFDSKEEFEKMKDGVERGCGQVVLSVDASDMEWIEKLQIRKGDERLKDEGRDLMTLEDVMIQEEHFVEDVDSENDRLPSKTLKRIPWLELMGLQ